jgi:glutamyl-tRNA synthetase
MEISHVIRAEEHLSNTPRQIFIAQSLGYELPRYAHLPFVAEPGSKNKLSKRKLAKYLKNRDFAKLVARGEEIARAIHLETSPEEFNPVIVDFYREIGFLPDAIVNYLALLGWSLDDKTEHFKPAELIEHFSLERVNKAAASFDSKKLEAFQARHMQELPIDEKVAMTMPYLVRAGLVDASDSQTDAMKEKLHQILLGADDRIKIAGDVLDYADFFTADDALEYDEKAFEKRLRKPEDAAELLKKFRDRLATADPFDAVSLDTLLHTFVESEAIQIGQIIHALRVAVTGRGVGIGMFDTLAILGRESCLARMDRTLEKLAE